VSEAKGEKPNPEHPQEDDLLLDFSTQHEEGAPQGKAHGQDHAEADALHPLAEPGINASTDEFQFTGPVEELDFTEPVDFTFPSEAAEVEAVSDSSADMGAVDHAGLEHLLGAEEAAPHKAAVSDATAEPQPAAEAPDQDLAEKDAEKEPNAKPKRELPAWVHALEWTAVALLAIGSSISLFVSIIWLDANTATLVLHIAFPVMLALIPYSLWLSSRRWMTPSISALYTVLLALGAAALIGGAWVEGMELASYHWQFNKTRLAADLRHMDAMKPPYVAPSDTSADAPK